MGAIAEKSPSEWAAEGNSYDCTSLIGHLDSGKPWGMYSYERPAYTLWNAIARALNRRGWSDDEIKDWLASKSPRWALDNELGDAIETVGELFALSLEKTATTPARNGETV